MTFEQAKQVVLGGGYIESAKLTKDLIRGSGLRWRYIEYPEVSLTHNAGIYNVARDERESILQKLSSSSHKITVISYCLMPNHFHLLLRQDEDGGISKYLADFQNSYTKYFDAKHKRSGALFDRQFKAVLVESENQLLHLTRYIHLNPYSSNMITKDQITLYPYSSLPEYLSGSYQLSNPNIVLDINPIRYEAFVLDHADYQQQLERLKHVGIDLET